MQNHVSLGHSSHLPGRFFSAPGGRRFSAGAFHVKVPQLFSCFVCLLVVFGVEFVIFGGLSSM